MTAVPEEFGPSDEADDLHLRQEYDYLFTDERQRLIGRITELESKNADLYVQVHEAREDIDRLAAARRRVGGKKKERNHVTFTVTVTVDGDADELGGRLWYERRKGDGPDGGLQLATYAVRGEVLRMAMEYTGKGGWESDIRNVVTRAADRAGVTVLDLEFAEQTRVTLDDPVPPASEASDEAADDDPPELDPEIPDDDLSG